VLDNEPVYAGQPLSYWRVEFGKESRLSSSLLTDDIAWQQTIDPAAVPLLVELLKDQNEYARAVRLFVWQTRSQGTGRCQTLIAAYTITQAWCESK